MNSTENTSSPQVIKKTQPENFDLLACNASLWCRTPWAGMRVWSVAEMC
jgi:hypothetical protein